MTSTLKCKNANDSDVEPFVGFLAMGAGCTFTVKCAPQVMLSGTATEAAQASIEMQNGDMIIVKSGPTRPFEVGVIHFDIQEKENNSPSLSSAPFPTPGFRSVSLYAQYLIHARSYVSYLVLIGKVVASPCEVENRSPHHNDVSMEEPSG